MTSLELPVEKVTIGAAAPPKLAPGNLGESKHFKTNITKILLQKNIVIYKYDVEIELIYEKSNGEEGRKSLTKGPRNDCDSTLRTTRSNAALKSLFNQNLSVFKKADLFYDSQANLYSTTQFADIIGNVNPKLVVPKDADCKSVEVKLTKVADSHQVSTNDVKKTVNPVYGKTDLTLLEALNTMITGSCSNKENMITYKGVHFALFPGELGFQERDLPTLDGGQYSGVGLSKAVKTLEGTTKGQAELHCVTEVKKTAFHNDFENLVDKFASLLKSKNENFNRNMVSTDPSAKFLKEKVKGLAVRLDYGDNKGLGSDAKSVVIGGFGPSAAEAKFECNGKKMTVQKYFEEKYNLKLKYPNLFTIYDSKKKNLYFPAECLVVGENQRVTIQQQTVPGQQVMVKASAVLPSVRLQQTAKMTQFVGITNSNKELSKIGISVDANGPVVVEGRVMPTPMISSGDARVNVKDNCKWNVQKYKKPASLPDKWAFYAISPGTNTSVFLTAIKNRVMTTGMKWTEPRKIEIGNERFDIEKIISSEKEQGTKFIFFVVRDMLNLHQSIKLYEQKFDILTQEVRATRARNIVEKGQPQTVENIVHKMNLKLGGANWEIPGYMANKTDYLNPNYNRLFFGFESSRSLGDDVVVVGYSANASKNSQNFIGNYKFVRQNKDIYGQVLKSAVEEMVMEFRKTRNQTPKHLYLYFNGVSEGQFALVANEYVKKIKEVCTKMNAAYKPHITVMCISKIHNERFFNQKIVGVKAAEQNIPPGSIIDKQIVSPVLNEFYLNSHSAFQGSAKTPKFSHVSDTSTLTMNDHEGIAHQLCYLHSIVSSTTSMPAPVLIADRCAKRGASNYQNSRADNRSVMSGESNIDLDALNRELSYTEKELFEVRFNA